MKSLAHLTFLRAMLRHTVNGNPSNSIKIARQEHAYLQ